MWIFTTRGFISVVAFRKSDHLLLVRARNRKHLEDLLPWADIQETRLADYRFRAVMDRDDFREFMAGQISDIGYDGFKNHIKADQAYKDSCYEVWLEMRKYQERGLSNGRRNEDRALELQSTKGRRNRRTS